VTTPVRAARCLAFEQPHCARAVAVRSIPLPFCGVPHYIEIAISPISPRFHRDRGDKITFW
jgi:hypothetical protein